MFVGFLSEYEVSCSSGPERLMSRRDTSPAEGIRSGEPFMVFRGVILTALTVRGPDGTSIHTQGQEDRWENMYGQIVSEI